MKGIISGGSSGILSLKNGLDYIRGKYSDEDIIVVQEATRPLVNVETISWLLQACSEKNSATICHSMNEYVQFSTGGNYAEYIDRDTSVSLQSP